MLPPGGGGEKEIEKKLKKFKWHKKDLGVGIYLPIKKKITDNGNRV